MGNLSILVISKTAQLLTQLLGSIPSALRGFEGNVEVLCSWNGSPEEEQKVLCPDNIELYFSQRTPYHFATNCNQLSRQACGDMLLFVNDDLILDPGSITAAVETLAHNNQCGIVGAKLSNAAGLVGHAGILFDHAYKPFHRYRDCPLDHQLTERTETVPAVTGAFLLTRANDYANCMMNETYINNGEDIELCLAYKLQLGLNTIFCHRASGHHPERRTRGSQMQDAGFGNDNSEDLARMRRFRQQFVSALSSEDRGHELDLAGREIDWCHQRIQQFERAKALAKETEALAEALAKETEALAAAEELKSGVEARKKAAENNWDQAKRYAEMEINEARLLSAKARQQSAKRS
ncbi:MAG: hypothetical protein FJ057_05475 [Cyanobacteria bacterium K_DeepCast_0m_m1_088]|nr:hypothetical protein [Cyanobacteria bacterium K_DeepCast_0m_m1_088]